MTLGFKVRPMQYSDLPAVLGIAGEYLIELDRSIANRFDLSLFSTNLKRTIDAESEQVFVLLRGQRIIGGLWATKGYSECYSSELQAADRLLFIRKEERGSRGFIKLLRAYEQWAEINNCDSITLSSISGIASERTQQLFERVGYKTSGYVCIKKLRR